MTTNIDALKLRQIMNGLAPTGLKWAAPTPFGDDGWTMTDTKRERSIIVTCAPLLPDNVEWVHASMTGVDDVPTWLEMKALHFAVFGTGWAYQVFAPPADHVNIHAHALHLWGRLDGKPALPDFSQGTGSI